ncbi:hypothetical protein V0U79_06120 [Hyphobacterium sp. HN65]|uniref:Uncharacterized protein n=1 Tax=Hyphobacterium lacteum TaxID=3116575 RepID=A0ABU7LPU3_9PROT|nr:hypothetical protein [Hyphobacterium sp. HN65]MEE2525935.1 hypothetical protein [Hyphobacterium sp. HN65]
MILSRLAHAVREQNWFAVILEFVIVISGVVIGFQVTELASAAHQRAEEQRALARLRLESEAVVAFWAEDVRSNMVRDQERLALLYALETGEIEPGTEGLVYSGVERLYFYAAITPPRTVFDELLASGGMSRISNSDAQAAVSEYADTLTFITGQLTQFRSSTNRGQERLQGRLTSRFDPSRSTLRRYEFDIPTLATDREFVSAVVDASRNQRVFLFFRIGALNDAIAMCEALSAAEGVPCGTAEAGRDQYEAVRAYLDETQEASE